MSRHSIILSALAVASFLALGTAPGRADADVDGTDHSKLNHGVLGKAPPGAEGRDFSAGQSRRERGWHGSQQIESRRARRRPGRRARRGPCRRRRPGHLGGSGQIKTTKMRGVRDASLDGALANPGRRAFGRGAPRDGRPKRILSVTFPA